MKFIIFLILRFAWPPAEETQWKQVNSVSLKKKLKETCYDTIYLLAIPYIEFKPVTYNEYNKFIS